MTRAERRCRSGPDLLVRILSTLLFVVAVPAPPAQAHAERVGSRPEPGARLREAPVTLSIDFTEPPTGDAAVEVLDGCGNDVVEEIEVANLAVSATLREGQPGRWEVGTTVVSGIDGHQTKDSWSFRVAGPRDCSAADGGERAAGETDEEGSPFPVVPVAIGAVAVLALAVLLRAVTGRSAD